MKKSLIIVLWSLFLILGSMGSAFGLTFTDSFEGSTLNEFWSVEPQHSNAEYSLSSTFATEGTQSLKLYSTTGGQRYVMLGHQFDQAMWGTVSVKFYDPTSLQLYSAMDFNNSATVTSMGIGVTDWDYTYYHASAGVAEIPSGSDAGQTTLHRTPGWHTFEAIYASNGVNLFIDGQLVRSTTDNTGFDHVQLRLSGPWGDGAFYFDQFSANVNPVPIPGSVLLMGTGLLGLVGLRRFRKV